MSKYLIENLFGIEGWNIAWYGVIIAVGMVLGVMLAIYRARKQGLKEDLIFDFILLALPIAIICARGYYVIFEWDSYSGDILSIFKIWKGGLAIYGGVIGGLVTDSSLQFFPYAVYIDALEEWHQATFFYESMWNVHHFRNKGITSFVIAFDFGRDAALCGICPSQQNETYIFREICE